MDNVKLIEKLREKKHREARKLFLIEGEKSILEAMEAQMEIEYFALTKDFYSKYGSKFDNYGTKKGILADGEIKKLSTLENNQAGIAIAKQQENTLPQISNHEIVLALDGVRDPGNLGTIIRIADWYGIKKIIASNDTVDVYNPKTINATMGSFTRIHFAYGNLFEILEKSPVPVLGTYLTGEDASTTTFPKGGILVIGNESHGVDEHISHLIKRKITIKRYGDAESLNAAIATAVVLDNWRRSLN